MQHNDWDSNLLGAGSKLGQLPCEVNNPFNMKYIQSIHMWAFRGFDGFTYEADIKFKKGDTEAKQNIKGSDLGEVFKKVYQFCENIDANTW